MNTEETEIYDFLKVYNSLFVSVTEISKRLGNRRRFDTDRTWARPILRRMEMDGLLESNPFGEYRLAKKETDTGTFKQALNHPGTPLGDTTIISVHDIEEEVE